MCLQSRTLVSVFPLPKFLNDSEMLHVGDKQKTSSACRLFTFNAPYTQKYVQKVSEIPFSVRNTYIACIVQSVSVYTWDAESNAVDAATAR